MKHYSSHLNRYTNRPGESIQMWLMSRIVTTFLENSRNVPGNVLEVGCGIGRAGRVIARKGIKYFGVEPTESLRKAAEENLSDVTRIATVKNFSFETLPMIKQKFDHAFAIHVIEHASSPLEARNWICAMKEQVEIGGFVSLACPNYFSYGKYFFDGDWTHAYPTTPNRLVSIGHDLDLKLISCKDTRATYSNPLIKALIGVFGLMLSVRIINAFGKRFFGIEYLGTGIKVALFWRLSILTFQRIN
jgi:SAM-dependent methyltransferase